MNLEQFELMTKQRTVDLSLDTINDLVAMQILAMKEVPQNLDIHSLTFDTSKVKVDKEGRKLVPVQYTLKERTVRYQQDAEAG